MKTMEEFSTLTDTEDFFEFFELEYTPSILDVKRSHIMRKFGEKIAKIPDSENMDEQKLLDCYRFALIAVYKDFEHGYSPSAADIWGSRDRPSPCGSCKDVDDCTPETIEQAGCGEAVRGESKES